MEVYIIYRANTCDHRSTSKSNMKTVSGNHKINYFQNRYASDIYKTY